MSSSRVFLGLGFLLLTFANVLEFQFKKDFSKLLIEFISIFKFSFHNEQKWDHLAIFRFSDRNFPIKNFVIGGLVAKPNRPIKRTKSPTPLPSQKAAKIDPIKNFKNLIWMTYLSIRTI